MTLKRRLKPNPITQIHDQRPDTACAATSSLAEGDPVDDEAILLEVYPHPEKVGAEGPSEHPLLRDLLGLVDYLPVKNSPLLSAHERVNQRHLDDVAKRCC